MGLMKESPTKKSPTIESPIFFPQTKKSPMRKNTQRTFPQYMTKSNITVTYSKTCKVPQYNVLK